MSTRQVTQALYVPKGRAQEYAPMAVNLYEGCSHRCTYCYVPQMYIRFGKIARPESFHRRCAPRPGVIEQLEKDVAAERWLRRRPGPVLLSFTGDCYNNHECHYRVTRRALEVLGDAGFAVRILTKAGEGLPNRDFDLMTRYDVELGVTLAGWSNKFRDTYEKNAPYPCERAALLREAQSRGIRTWASVEPVIDPEEALTVIDRTHRSVGYYRVGKINHDAELERAVQWTKFLRDVLDALTAHGCRYVVKDDLWLHADADMKLCFAKEKMD